jgi:hypothetical protein
MGLILLTNSLLAASHLLETPLESLPDTLHDRRG